jgi:hypothetical protein
MQQNQIKEIKMTNNTPHKRLVFLLFICTIVLFLSPNLHSYICANGSGDGFCDPDGGKEYSCNNVIINNYIEEGAGYFLNSYSNALYFLNRVELSNLKGIDCVEWSNILNSAAANIKNAKGTYSQLIKTAESTPYNQKIISKLKSFDYYYFMKENDLNDVIFNEVADFLKNGDIIGVYKWIYLRMSEIEDILFFIKIEMNFRGIPALANLWKLNGAYSRALLFGQYVAMVFDAISEEV